MVFVSDIPSESLHKGLNEQIIESLSAKKKEPSWILNLRIKAYRHWLNLKEPKLGQTQILSYQLSGYPILFCSKTTKKAFKP